MTMKARLAVAMGLLVLASLSLLYAVPAIGAAVTRLWTVQVSGELRLEGNSIISVDANAVMLKDGRVMGRQFFIVAVRDGPFVVPNGQHFAPITAGSRVGSVVILEGRLSIPTGPEVFGVPVRIVGDAGTRTVLLTIGTLVDAPLQNTSVHIWPP